MTQSKEEIEAMFKDFGLETEQQRDELRKLAFQPLLIPKDTYWRLTLEPNTGEIDHAELAQHP